MILSAEEHRHPSMNASPTAFSLAAPKTKPVFFGVFPLDHGSRNGPLADMPLPMLVASLLPACGEMVPETSLIGETIGNLFVTNRRPSILIVDDEAINIDLLADLFKDKYELMTASDGDTALDTAATQTPDLILLDVMMPGIDGYEVCRRLKANRRTQDIPIIFITALGEGIARNVGLEMGARDYLTKPIDPSLVSARVNNQITLMQVQDRLMRLAALEQALRENLLEAADLNNGLN